MPLRWLRPLLQQRNRRHEHEQATKRANNGRARRQVAVEGPVQTANPPQPRNDPAKQQPRARAARQIDAANRRHDQITEYKKYSGDSDKDSHDQPKAGVKQKVPPSHPQSFLVGAIAIKRDEQKISAQNEMENADRDK